MLTVDTRPAVSPTAVRRLDTTGLRAAFPAEGLFRTGEIRLTYTHYDRMIVGGAVPGATPMTLDHVREAGPASLLDRRELAIVNIGGAGTITATGQTHAMERGDVLYLGLGAGPVTLAGAGRFYLVAAPAHATHPTRLVRNGDARQVRLRAAETSNDRTIFQFVHPDVMPSCQLVLAYARFAAGSVWNTMPAHLHDRRMEAYLYFDLADTARDFHMMGEPSEMRHLVVKNEEAVLSPPWPIHCGAGTGAYTLIGAMAGDNVDDRDVEMVAIEDLR